MGGLTALLVATLLAIGLLAAVPGIRLGRLRAAKQTPVEHWAVPKTLRRQH
jgi:hypothetical protein